VNYFKETREEILKKENPLKITNQLISRIDKNAPSKKIIHNNKQNKNLLIYIWLIALFSPKVSQCMILPWTFFLQVLPTNFFPRILPPRKNTATIDGKESSQNDKKVLFVAVQRKNCHNVLIVAVFLHGGKIHDIVKLWAQKVQLILYIIKSAQKVRTQPHQEFLHSAAQVLFPKPLR